MSRLVLLTGSDLTRQDFADIVLRGRPVGLSPKARRAMTASRRVVERAIREKRVVYGVTTGVGSLSTERIDPAEARQLQLNVVRSHCCGVGEPLSIAETRGLLLLRANTLAAGLSGIRPLVADMLCGMLNHRLHPVVPARGSVGASGDLAPLAHVALTLVGEGEVTLDAGSEVRSRPVSARTALRRAGLSPLQLEAKEGISLVNGTQAMLSLGLLALAQAEVLADTADVAGSLSLDALRGSPAAFDERLQRARPHPGQSESARNLARLNEGSAIRESHRDCARLQDAYSLRCIPQVHGAVRDAIGFARGVFEIEMNSTTDNPLVFADEGEVLSGGNFHGQPVATALDLLAIALTQLGGISERRIDRMVNPLTSDLPPFLARNPGLESGMMLAQVTAAALVSESKVLAHPTSVDSIPTSGNKEDYVSMGMAAALKLRQVVTNVASVLAIELLTASHALDCLAPLKTGRLAVKAQQIVRRVAPPLTGDRAHAPEIASVAGQVLRGEYARVLSQAK
ncbi:MAG TPA: histidine ammonia-lyase [Terriglobia bacterium]|nr:histidine ammonia-lyase [Terriglobia bacterium]